MTIKIGLNGQIITGGSGGSQNLFDVLSVDNSAGSLQIKDLANPTDPQDAVTLSFLQSSVIIPGLAAVLNTSSFTGGHNIVVSSGDVITINDIPVLSTSATNKAYVDATIDGYNYSSLIILGDVSGTLAASTVDKLKNIPLSIPSHTATQDGYVLTYVNGSTNLQLKPTGVGVIILAGDVTGLYSANTVVKINGASVTTIGSSNTVLGTTNGTSISYFQIANAQVSSTAAITLGKLADGSALSVIGRSANSSGAHADIAGSNNQALRISGSVLGFGTIDLSTAIVTGTLPTGNQASQSMAGDVSGTTAASTVDKIKGKTLAASVGTVGASQDGYALAWNNGTTSWTPTLISSGGGAPSGPAGGDLSGTYPNPTVAKINATTISTAGGALTTGNVLRVTGSATADYGAVDLANANAVTGTLPAGNQASQTLGGDLSGTTAAATVIKLQGNSVDNTSLGANQDGYFAEWINGSSKIIFKPNNRLTPFVIITTTSTLSDGYNLILVDTSGARTLNLPAPASNVGVVFRIKDIIGTAGTNNITLVRNGSEQIEGVAASRILSTNWGYWELWTNGTDWFFLN